MANITNTMVYAWLSTKNTYKHADPVGTEYKKMKIGEEEVSITINGQETSFKLIDKAPANDHGYQGYAYENTVTKEIVVVHEGSVPITSGYQDEINKDWKQANNDIIQGKMPNQFYDAKAFVERVISKNQDAFNQGLISQTGQSLGGALAEMTGALLFDALGGAKTIETITFNSLGVYHLLEKLTLDGQPLSNNYTNINNYTYNNELVSKLIPHLGNMYNANVDVTDKKYSPTIHNVEIHQEGQTYEQYGNEITLDRIIRETYDDFIIEIKNNGINLGLIINLPENLTLMALKNLIIDMRTKGYLGPNIFKIQLSTDNISYDIQKGDTVWELCQKYGTTYEELIELNPWLAERFSDDMEYALIKVGEKLTIPYNNKHVGVYEDFTLSFNQAQSVTVRVDPILVDLDNDGKISTTAVNNGTFFDHENDGFAETSAWVDKNDGVLAIDKNNDGIINNGTEIFGDNYVKEDGTIATNGFDALADLDSNSDGVIDSSDTKFNDIKILKGDGTVLTLSEAGITSINLTSTSSNTVDENGNTIISSATYTKTDGTQGILADYNLNVDKFNSITSEWLDETDEVKALPDVLGSGTVHSLHQAILRDETGELKQLVNNYINITTNVYDKNEALQQLIYKWTGADTIAC